MRKLRPVLSKYLRIEVVDDHVESQSDNSLSLAVVNSMLLHQHYACHIINLIVKEALQALKPLIETFRTAISFLNSYNQRIATYKCYCIATGVRPKKFQLDIEVRWNSTYLMLKHLFPHKVSFTTFMHAHYLRIEGGPLLLTDEHWAIVEKVLKFLELFYDSTVSLSGM
jgi:hypothetical protein